jgi:hypothetical protein
MSGPISVPEWPEPVHCIGDEKRFQFPLIGIDRRNLSVTEAFIERIRVYFGALAVVLSDFAITSIPSLNIYGSTIKCTVSVIQPTKNIPNMKENHAP